MNHQHLIIACEKNKKKKQVAKDALTILFVLLVLADCIKIKDALFVLVVLADKNQLNNSLVESFDVLNIIQDLFILELPC